jgi:hypothetical protein
MSKYELRKITQCQFACYMTNKRSHVAKGLVEDAIKNMKQEKFLG